jgi:aspartyl/asparaginyl beta-hydroxylase (cupin superfamily)
MTMEDRPLIPERFLTYIRQIASADGRRRMNVYPGLTAQPWHDPQRVSIARDFERHAAEVIAEAHAIERTAFRSEEEHIGRVGRWSVLFLFERGYKNEHNCTLCPTTTAIIEATSAVTTMCGMVYLSCLDSHTHVAPHKGPTNMRLRCHFGIDVPDGCGIRVHDTVRTWTSGRCLVFDDSFEHEAWNSSIQPRTVLVVDVWHPDLTEEEVRLLDGLQRYASGRRACGVVK